MIFDKDIFCCSGINAAVINGQASDILKQFNLELGTGPMQVHMNLLSTNIVADPGPYVLDKNF